MYSFLSIFLLQTQEQSWLFSSDKINAVMSVVLVIFLGFLLYLTLMQRKVGELEKKMDELDKQS